MMRLCLAAFYSKDGIVNEYFLYYLAQLRPFCDYMIVTTNGAIADNGKAELLETVDEVLVRDNHGFDFGAHAYAAAHIGREKFASYDEVIITNDTFYGPFLDPAVLFEKFDKSDSDFASPTGFDNRIWKRQDSYLLFLKKKCLDAAYDFLIDYNQKGYDSYIDALVFGEQGFSKALWDAGFQSMTFCPTPDNTSVTLSPYQMLSEYGLFLLKRKCMVMAQKVHSAEKDEKSRVSWILKDGDCIRLLSALRYIGENTDYPLRLILEDATSTYGVELSEDDVYAFTDKSEEKTFSVKSAFSAEELADHIKGKDSFYIYGNGLNAARIYHALSGVSDLFKGFIVSDGQDESEPVIKDEKLYFWSVVKELKDYADTLIIISMEKSTSDKLKASVNGRAVLYLW